MGVNSRSDLARAEALLQAQLRMAAMASGVTLRAPDTVFLSADSVIERDVIIEPHVVIGTGCHIGEGSVIKAFSHIEGARLGTCCVIGPYARLRPGTNAADGVKIGNFVETKDVNLGDGAKASHLSYLGDAEVGAQLQILGQEPSPVIMMGSTNIGQSSARVLSSDQTRLWSHR